MYKIKVHAIMGDDMLPPHENKDCKAMSFSPISRWKITYKERIRHIVWNCINHTLYRWMPNYFRGWRRMLLRFFGGVLAGTSGQDRNADIIAPWNLCVGEFSSIGDGCYIYCLDKIFIGNKCCISRGVQLLTGSHDITSKNFDLITKPIIIKDAVWIATDAKILPGVTLNEGAVVAAGSVVTKDVAAWTVVGGNPAKVIKQRELVLKK